MTRTARLAASLRGSTSASTGVSSATSVVSVASAARVSPKARAPPRSRPSAIQTIEVPAVLSAKVLIAAPAAARSGSIGCGLIARRRSSAAAASSGTTVLPPSDTATTATGRPAWRAASMRWPAAIMRLSQAGAAAQPSSSATTRGPLPLSPAPIGFQIGPAIARMISVANTRRSSSSHHGVEAGVSSLGLRSRISLSGGNGTRSGRGGVTRSST